MKYYQQKTFFAIHLIKFSQKIFFANFFFNFKCIFVPSPTFYLPYGCSNWWETKKNESAGCYAEKGTFDLDLWPWIFKVNLYLGNGRPDCHGMKGMGVNMMPWSEILRLWVNWMLRWLGYLWPWPLTFKVKLYLGNGRPDYYGMKGTGVDRMPGCEIQPLYDLKAEGTYC